MDFDLTDDEWCLLEPLLPSEPKPAGADNRRILPCNTSIGAWLDVEVPGYCQTPGFRLGTGLLMAQQLGSFASFLVFLDGILTTSGDDTT